MDARLLLVKAITLLYRESQISVGNSGSGDLVKDIATQIKIPEASLEGSSDRDVIISLRGTAMWMVGNPADYDYDKNMLLQRIRVNTGYNHDLYHAFEDGMYDLETDEEIKRVCLEYRSQLSSHLQKDIVKDIMKKSSQEIMFNEDEINWKTFVSDLVSDLEPYLNIGNGDGTINSMDVVDFNDPEGLSKMFERATDEVGGDGTLRCGWQGINRMTGDHDGFRRGEFTAIGALQHNYKTGFTLNLFKQFALYNKPYMRDPTKKPMLVHLSLENNLTDNLIWLYVSLKENETGEPIDVKAIDPVEASIYVKEKLMQNGYYIHMCRENPSDYTHRDMFNMIENLEAQGYEVHAVVCDYLNMMSKAGCNVSGPMGEDIRDLFRRVRNFMAPRGIAFVTPHQLSTEAKGLVRQGVDNFVQEIANKGYWDGCRRLDQELDFELYVHIEKKGDKSYLTVQRGKHRKVAVTPHVHHYTVLPFDPIAGIPDDVNGRDRSLKKVPSAGGLPEGEGWWNS